MTAFAIAADRTFDGESVREGVAVVIGSGRIREVVPVDTIWAGIEVRQARGLLCPGFIDVQVNGGGGILFNETPTVEGIRVIGAAHRRFGTTGFLPTLITDAPQKMTRAVAAVGDGLRANVPGLLGIHLEGPFINPARKGAHDDKLIREMTEEDFERVTSLEGGRTVMTLAPERPEFVDSDYISRLARAGVLVSAGHTTASLQTMRRARKDGVVAYTHLFNAMPDLDKRKPGPVGAALTDPDAWCSIIVDLEHVSEQALRIALAARGVHKTMLITDAMPVTGTDATQFKLGKEIVYRRNGRLEFENGTLAGADLDMATAVRNAHRTLGVDLAAALRMASLVPAEFLRLDHELGRIAPKYRANLALLDDDFVVRSTWIDGAEQTEG